MWQQWPILEPSRVTLQDRGRAPRSGTGIQPTQCSCKIPPLARVCGQAVTSPSHLVTVQWQIWEYLYQIWECQDTAISVISFSSETNNHIFLYKTKASPVEMDWVMEHQSPGGAPAQLLTAGPVPTHLRYSRPTRKTLRGNTTSLC